MQGFMETIKNNDTNQIIELLHSKQISRKQIHQTLTTFKHNYSRILNG